MQKSADLAFWDLRGRVIVQTKPYVNLFGGNGNRLIEVLFPNQSSVNQCIDSYTRYVGTPIKSVHASAYITDPEASQSKKRRGRNPAALSFTLKN